MKELYILRYDFNSGSKFANVMITAHVLDHHSLSFVTLSRDSFWTEVDGCDLNMITSLCFTNYAFVS
jgi:hypothetical protein